MAIRTAKSRLVKTQSAQAKLGKIKLARGEEGLLAEPSVKSNTKKVLIWMLIVGFLFRFGFSVLPFEVLKGFVCDDAYYYFCIAKTFVKTGMLFSADGITYTNGFHPLWLFTILPFWFLAGISDYTPIRMVMMWGALLDVGASIFLFLLLRRFFEEKISLLLTAFYLFNPVNIVQAVTGMETPINSFLIALLLYMVVVRSWTSLSGVNQFLKKESKGIRRWSILFGIISGLVLLARTDNAFLVGGAFVFVFLMVWRKGLNPISNMIWSLGSCAVVIAPWYLYNLFKFHTILQTSAWAYPWIYHDEFIRENGSYFSWALFGKLSDLLNIQLNSIGAYFGSPFIFAVIFGIVLGFILTKKEKIKSRALLKGLGWALISTGVYLFFHIFIRWFPRIWYQQSVFIVCIPFLGLFVTLFKRKLVLVLVSLFFLLSSIYTITTVQMRNGSFMRVWKSQLRADVAVNLIEEFVPPNETVGAWNSGYVQYWSNRRVINLDGLANSEILEHYKKGTPTRYLIKRNIKWMVDNPSYFKWSFAKYFEKEAREKCFIVKKSVEDIGLPGNAILLVKVFPDEGFTFSSDK